MTDGGQPDPITPTVFNTPAHYLSDLIDRPPYTGRSEVAEVAFGWMLECLRHLKAPDHAIEIMTACAQISTLVGNEDALRALVEAEPELDVYRYREMFDAGAIPLDWRCFSMHMIERQAPGAPVRSFANWCDQTDMAQAWEHATNWAMEILAGGLDLHPGNFTAHLFALVDHCGDAVVAAGLRTLDDITEEVLTVIGCPPDRSSRLAIVTLSATWEGTVADLVDAAPRAFANPSGDAVGPERSDGLYWVEAWQLLNPYSHQVFL